MFEKYRPVLIVQIPDAEPHQIIDFYRRYGVIVSSKCEFSINIKLMKVKILPLNNKFSLPVKAHTDDFCYDVYATSEEEIAPGIWKYGLGFALECEANLYDEMRACFTLRPRSSIWKTGMVLSNSLGTIDYGYRGEVCAVFYHVMPSMPRYRVGDRVAQLHVDLTEVLDFELVGSLSPTERGEGGYGSTGK